MCDSHEIKEYVVHQCLIDKLTAGDGLVGFSKPIIEQHLGLYKGYVANLTTLQKELKDARANGLNNFQVQDRRRRLGFEFNGVALHELYFNNLVPGGNPPTEKLKGMIAAQFGSFDAFLDEFLKVGLTRSIGWVILYLDPTTGYMGNHFVELHENGNVAGLQPLLVMDVWEHSYILDHGAAGRGAYIQNFKANIDFAEVERRVGDAMAGKIVKRFV